MKTFSFLRGTFLLGSLLAIGLPAFALPVTGLVNIGGSSTAVTTTAVDFYGGAFCQTANPGSAGCFLALLPLTGDFTTLVPGAQSGTIKDLQGPPVSGNISLADFVVFTNGVHFDLTRVIPGGAPDCATVNTNAPNATCTPVLPGGQISPFVLTNSNDGPIASNASVFFNVEVSAWKGSSGTGTSFFTGAFNTPSAGKNIADILTDISNNVPVAAAYSANFVGAAAVPEPGTVTMLGIGAIAILFGRMRAKRRSDSN